jgi:hypothetical protein
MTDFQDGYDDFLNEASKDDRIGKHKAMVLSVTQGSWPAKDGQPERSYHKVDFRLANGSKIDMRWSEPPNPAPSKEEMRAMDRGRAQSIVNAVSLRRQLIQHFGKTIPDLKEGDEVGLLIEPQKSKKDGKSYPRVRAFIPLDDVRTGTTGSEDIPF